jgi:pyruvate formate lyase activating enzyme
MYVGRYWHRRDDGRIECDLCPRRCRLKDGQRAFCFVRERRGDAIVLATWGKSTGFCVDPIEKKPLAHFLPGTPVLSFGTAGCNLGCKFCQNWDISKSREVERLSEEATPAAIARAAVDAGCRSVAFTYNDPVIWAEYAIDTAIACRASGLRTVAVTAGYITPEARPEFFAHMDAANVDLKGFTEDFYRELCFAHLEPVLDTLRWLVHERKTWLEVTTLLIPGRNDSDAEISRLAEWFVRELGPDVPLHFSAFHPDFRLMDVPPTPPATLTRARRIAVAAGLRYVYTGNVHDLDGGQTRCPSCGEAVIRRDGYRLLHYDVRDGACGRCATPIAGVFENRPGNWGSRRLPVHVGGG